MNVTRAQPPREHVDGARRIDRAGREHVDEKQLSFGHGMHRNVAIVVQERRGQAAGLPVAERRDPGGIHPGGTRGGDDQTADQCPVSQLIGGHAEKVGDDVLKVSRQARQGTARVVSPCE